MKRQFNVISRTNNHSVVKGTSHSVVKGTSPGVVTGTRHNPRHK